MATDYTKMSTEELGCIYSDYFKDVHGFRPRNVSYKDRDGLIKGLVDLDNYIEVMKSTKEGRNQLREEGWCIAEHQAEDGWDQRAWEKRQQDWYDEC